MVVQGVPYETQHNTVNRFIFIFPKTSRMPLKYVITAKAESAPPPRQFVEIKSVSQFVFGTVQNKNRFL
jgi:hypothetical protein